jgi:hypothetical protein
MDAQLLVRAQAQAQVTTLLAAMAQDAGRGLHSVSQSTLLTLILLRSHVVPCVRAASGLCPVGPASQSGVCFYQPEERGVATL